MPPTDKRSALIAKLESLQDDGSEGMPWSQEEIDLIIAGLKSQSAVLEPVLCDSATAVCSICQEPVERHRDIEAVRSSARVQEPVAWRWHYIGGDEPDVWGYLEHKPDSKGKIIEPLYAAPSANVSRKEVAEVLQYIESRIEGWNARADSILNGRIARDELIPIGNTLRQILRRAEGRGANG